MRQNKRAVHVGLDIGTTNITLVALDLQECSIVDYRSASNDRYTNDETYAYAQDPKGIERQVRLLMEGLDAPIASICVTGQVHGILYYDDKGEAVSPLYTWLDQRGMVEIDGKSSQRVLFEETGTLLPAGYGLLCHFANRRMGKVPTEAVGFCGILEYITGRLIGSPLRSSDPSCLGTYGAFDPVRSEFDPAVLEFVMGRKSSRFLGSSGPFTVAGYGEGGVPVAYPVGDNQAGFFGMVPDWSGAALVSIGTSGQISLFSNQGECPPSMELRPFLGQGYLHVGATLTAGKAYEVLEKLFAAVVAECGYEVDHETVFSMMRRVGTQSSKVEPLVIDTRLTGTRREPLVRGSIGNVGIDTLNIRNLVRGTVAGIIGELHGFVSDSTQPIESLVAIGSSVRHNILFRDELERKFGVAPVVPQVSDGAGLGAALIGAVSIGDLSLTDVHQVVTQIAYTSES